MYLICAYVFACKWNNFIIVRVIVKNKYFVFGTVVFSTEWCEQNLSKLGQFELLGITISRGTGNYVLGKILQSDVQLFCAPVVFNS